MKFSLVFLGLVAVATAVPRPAEHAALTPLADGRDIQNGDKARRTDSSQIYVVRANTDSVKRNLGENIEARQAGEIAEAAAEIIGDVIDLVEGIVSAVQADNSKRDQFTVDTVTQEGQKFPGFNWVICHVAHTTAFAGTQGTDWGHSHVELDMTIGTVGFELYWFRSGTFTRNGDGGFLNWAYEGVVTGTENGGSVVHFAAP